jgi:RNA polymerase sigma-70 factor, ECF subfamily
LDTIQGGIVTVGFLESAFHMHYEGVHRYAYTILQDNEAAKDAVQQVFINLWEKREKINITTSFKAYLYRAVYNHCINQQTRVPRHQPFTVDHAEQWQTPAELLAESRELRTMIGQAIENLPAQCKLIFLKSRMDEKTYPVIAKELGISVKTVEAQITKALRILRGIFNKYKTIFYAILASGGFFK